MTQPFSIYEWLAAITTIVSVALLSYKFKSGWIIGFAGSLLYGKVFYDQKLYADFWLQAIFLIQGAYGYFEWNQNIKKDDKFVSLNFKRKDVFFIMISLVGFLIISYIAGSLMRNTNNPYPLTDGFISIFSIMAVILMARRHIECWYVWFVIDVVSIALFLQVGMYVSIILYLVLLLNCCNGWMLWKKDLKEA